MPQEPKRRHSRQRKGKRRSGIRLQTPRAIYCSNCQSLTLPHQVCRACGFYKGRQVFALKKK